MLTNNCVMIEMKNRELVWDVKFWGVTIGDSLEIKDARRRRSSADARPVSSSRDAGLAKIVPGRKARFAGKGQLR